VRPCIACDTCIASANAGRIACAVNAEIGRELAVAARPASPRAPKRVVIAGGGPAGLEAARVAAERGHTVTLLEARHTFGGQLRIASLAPQRQPLGALLSWYARQLDAFGVELWLGANATRASVGALDPDVVLVATGSTPRLDGVQWSDPGEPLRCADGAKLTSSWDVLTAAAPFAGSALVVDDTGAYEATAAAERLLEDGVAVTFATRHDSFMPLGQPFFEARAALRRMRAHEGFALHTRCLALGARPGEALLRYRDGGVPFAVPADRVVFVSPNASQSTLTADLEDVAPTVRPIGDAISQRYLRQAIADGFDAACAI
jgi:hypothetical protein